MATALGHMCVENQSMITTSEQAQTLMDVLRVLYVRDEIDGHYLLSKCIQLIQLSDVNETIQVIVNSIYHLVFMSTE